MIKKTLIRSLSKLLHIAGYDLQRNSKRSNYSYHNLLDRILQYQPGFRFLQIGGCDGKSFDPLYPYVKTSRGFGFFKLGDAMENRLIRFIHMSKHTVVKSPE